MRGSFIQLFCHQNSEQNEVKDDKNKYYRGVFMVAATFYFYLETGKHKLHRLEKIWGWIFERMGRL